MKNEMFTVWQEILGDFNHPVFIWQIVIIVLGLATAWMINGILRRYVMAHAPLDWKAAIGGINRVLFPLSALVFIFVAKLIMHQWYHVSALKLAVTLLFAMAVIRLAVYALRYIFSPSGWLYKTEHLLAGTIWFLLALHLSGVLPDLLQALDDVSFSIGKNKLSLLLIIQGLVTVVLTVIVALWLSRMIENRLMRTEQLNGNMRVVITKVVRIILTVMAVLFAFSAIGLDLTLLSVFGGALGVGLGFGLQKIASNFVSGFIILLDDSMRMGDIITVDHHYGIVRDLRARYLVLAKLDGTQVVIPNETLITNPVINHSYADRRGKAELSLQVSYDSDLELAIQLLKQAAQTQERVMQTPAPEVLVKGFGESGIDLTLTVWIPDPEVGHGGLVSTIYQEIWRAFKLNNISIPYPQREIRILEA
jgi:small-conductance mechanosensitive channel